MFHVITRQTRNFSTAQRGSLLPLLNLSKIVESPPMVKGESHRNSAKQGSPGRQDSVNIWSNHRKLSSRSSQQSSSSHSRGFSGSIGSNQVDLNRMKVYPVKALQDNYMYLLVDESTRQAAAVDPVNASAMADAVSSHGAELKCILTTHHHYDHAHGNSDMLTMFPDLVVYGGDQRVQALTKSVAHGEIIKLGSLTIECLSTPCHTRGHVCYYVHNCEIPSAGVQSFSASPETAPAANGGSDQQIGANSIGAPGNAEFPASPPPSQTASAPACSSPQGSQANAIERVVFTGDTLFIAGCGRFFEGTSEQMDLNLNTVLGGLPNDTRVYCGHEYTVSNLKFALAVEPQNTDIKMKLDWALAKVAKREPTVPSTIGEEKRINPFMRLNKSQVRRFAREQSDLEVMSALRQKKNEFVAS